MSVGHISGRLDSQKVTENIIPLEILQIDAAVNPGNSGGPIFNMKGEVVGIVSHILSQSGGFEGLGFGVAINTAKKQLLEKDPFWGGVEFILASDDLAEALNMPQESGLLVLRVAYGSPAEKAGLRPGKLSAMIDDKKLMLGGDIILEVNGKPITKELKTLEPLAETTPSSNALPHNDYC
jgi:serine protease Do